VIGPTRLPEARRSGGAPAPTAVSNALLALGTIFIATFGALIGLGVIFREPAALPALLIGGALAVFLLDRPQWIVPSFIAITWAALPGRVFGGLPSPVELGGIVLLVFAAWRALEWPRLTANLVLIMFLMAAPLVVSAALSNEGAAFPISDLREILFVFIVGLCVYGAGGAERVVMALVVVGLILGLGGISSILIGPSELFPVITDVATAIEPEAPRAGGPFGEPNFYALSMAALTPLALFVVTKGGWWRYLGLTTLVAIAGAILAAGSRGGAIAMLFALFAVAVTTPNRQLRLAAISTVLVAAALIPLFAGQTGNSASRSVGGRQTENQIALAMMESRPVVGVGPGRYEVLYRDYSRNIGDDPRPIREPHSLPLEIAAEQGVAGLIGWFLAGVVALTYCLSRGIWRTTLGRALLLSVATYLVGSLFLHGSQLRLLFILVGLTMAYAAELLASTGNDGEATRA
jgi:O-antigen ligase